MGSKNPLFQAIEDDDHTMVLNLLEDGVATDIRNKKDETPLCLASRLKRYAIAETIIAHEKKQCQKKNTTALFLAIDVNDLDAVNDIIQKDIDLKQSNSEGLTVIALAAKRKHWACVEALASKTHPEAGDKEAFGLAFNIAAKDDQMHIVNLLIIHKNLSLIFDSSGRNALHHAIQNQNTAMLKLMIRSLPKSYLASALPSRRAPIEYAAALGDWEAVDILLNSGVRTRLEFVLCQAMLVGDLTRAKKLINTGANIEASFRKRDRASLLHIAVETNNPKAVVFLLSFIRIYSPYSFFSQDKLLDLNARNKQGITALQLALRLEHWQCVREVARGRNSSDLVSVRVNVLFNLLFQNVVFKKEAYYHPLILNKRKDILNYILQLPVDIKKEALEKALDKTTIIGDFFAKNQQNILERTIFHRDKSVACYRNKMKQALERIYVEADLNEQKLSASTGHELVPLNF